ncbi:MAG: hypothetical protein V3T23_01690 [Nitrososphaerales archaeon]
MSGEYDGNKEFDAMMQQARDVGQIVTPRWLDIPVIFGTILGFAVTAIYYEGFNKGLEIQNITEIVWIERTPEPLNMLLWDVECVLVAKETTS